MALADLDLSAILAPKRPKFKAPSSVETAYAVQTALESARKNETLSKIDQRALAGDAGAKAARSALDRILESPFVSEGLKKRAKKYYETQNGDLDNSFIDSVRDTIGDIFSKGLTAIDKPKRAVVATEENILSSLGVIDKKKGQSWVDRVLHDKEFGYGDVLNEIATQNPDLPGAGVVAEDRYNVASGLGLVGDVVSDPLTYAGVGVIDDVVKGTVKGAEAVSGAERAAEALDSAAKVASKIDTATAGRKALRLTKRDVQHKAAELGKAARKAGDEDAAKHYESLIAKAEHGLGKLNSKDLSDLGVRGGIRLGSKGPTIVPWSVTRHAGAPFRALDEVTRTTEWGRRIFSNFGEKRLNNFRDILRDPKADPADKANAVLGIDAVRHADDGRRVFQKRHEAELRDILKEAQDAGVNEGDIHAAVNGDEAAIGRVSAKWDGLHRLSQHRVKEANDINTTAGRALVAEELGNDLPLVLNDKTMDAIRAKSTLSPLLDTASLKNLYKGMEILPQQFLGSKELVQKFGQSLVAQAEGVIRKAAPELGDLYEVDGFKALVAEHYGNAALFGKVRGENRLRKLGVMVEQGFRADEQVQSDIASAIASTKVHFDDMLDELSRARTAVVDAAQEVADSGGLRQAQTTLRANIKVLRNAEVDAERAYDAARAAGAPKRTLDRLRREMLAIGNDRRAASKQLQFLKAQDGVVEDDIIRRIGTVQAAPRGSLAGNPIVDPAYSHAEGTLAQGTEAGRIFNDPESASLEAQARLEQREAALGEVSPRNVSRAQGVASAVNHSEDAARITEIMADPNLDEPTKYALGLHAAYHEAAARLDEAGKLAMTDEDMLRYLRSRVGQKTIQDVVNKADGFVQFGKDFEQVPSYVRESMIRAHSELSQPEGVLKAYDAFIRGFKTYAILTPGFPVRNSFGAFFNNYVAGIDTASYTEFGKWFKKYQQGWIKTFFKPGEQGGGIAALEAAGAPDDVIRIFREMETKGQFADANRIVGEVAAAINPEIGADRGRRFTNWALPRKMRSINERVEQYHRGALMYDTLKKASREQFDNGNAFAQGLERVYRFHFDYSDLSDFETNVVRRIVPFWVWTSRNLPLQLEQIAKNPRMYERFNQVKANFGQDDRGSLVPDYIRKSPVAIYLNKDLPVVGHVDYLTPDLPFNNVPEQLDAISTLNPVNVFGPSSSPAFRLPFELFSNQQFFGDIPLSDSLEPAPGLWTKVPGLMELFEKAHLAKRSRDGEWLMSNKNLYVLNSVVPTIAQSRRLLPSEDKYNARWQAAISSYFGIGSRNISDTDRTNAAYGVADVLQRVVAEQRELGKIESAS